MSLFGILLVVVIVGAVIIILLIGLMFDRVDQQKGEKLRLKREAAQRRS